MNIPKDKELTYNFFALINCIKNTKNNKCYYLVYFPELENSLTNNVTQGYSFANAIFMGFDFLSILLSEDNLKKLNKLLSSFHIFDKSMNYLDKMKYSINLLNKNDFLDKNDKLIYQIGIPMKIKMAYEFRSTIIN